MSETIKGYDLPQGEQVNDNEGLKWAKDVFGVPDNAKCVIICPNVTDSPNAIFYCTTRKRPNLKDEFVRMSCYEVTCDNVGTVYNGFDETQARNEYTAYVALSKQPTGTASNEDVTLFENGEPIEEYNAPKTHYHAMNGSSGCMPDNNVPCETEQAAIDFLCNLFEDCVFPEELTTMREELTQNGIYHFNSPEEAGADYAEVTECDEADCTERE